MVKIIYSSYYLDYSFGKDHPFWPERAVQFLEKMKEETILNPKDTSEVPACRRGRSADFTSEVKVINPEPAKDNDTLLVHAKDYLERVKKYAREGGALSIDTPVTSKNLEAAYYYVGGTILAGKLALRGEKVINLLGGLHHAGISQASGFCIFNDHAIAIRKLQKTGKIKKAAVLDLDVHAGNGTQEIFYSDPSVLTISIHQDPTFFYPGTGFSWQKGKGKGRGFNFNFPLPSGTKEGEYLQVLDKAIALVKKFKPALLFCILGTDTYKNDPLAGFKLEKKSYQKIGQRLKIFQKMAILFAGGYSKEVPDLWFSFIAGLCANQPLGLER